jgi:hypothetical protein
VGNRRIPTRDENDDPSEQSTRALSDFILGWKQGDPIAVAELTPWLKREVARQLQRFREDSRGADHRVDVSQVINATLYQVAVSAPDPLPHRVHLMATVAPLFRQCLVEAARNLQGSASFSRALFESGRGQIDVVALDEALTALSAQDSEVARIAELRLFTAMSTTDVAFALSVPAAGVRQDWNLARAWLYGVARSDTDQLAPGPMELGRWAVVKRLFTVALAKAPAERAGFLAAACPDEALRAAVQTLTNNFAEAHPVLGTEALHGYQAHEEDQFLGTDRFRLEQRLGSGGFGVVYRALDRKRNEVVALKTLSPTNVDALYRLKREFRSLADLSHPNLIRLFELFSEGAIWFFTMELVDGVNFLDFVRPQGRGPLLSPDEGRLRSALLQLAEGVSALHQARRLHRDLKPSNVLVSHEGSLRILDFGLITDLSQPATDQSSRIVGTPAYMAPELATRDAPTEASDWYGVGMMLYEALTGRVPFSGGFVEILIQKRDSPAPRPSCAGGTDIPEDLDALCTSLLDPDPLKRPSGREVLRTLQAHAPSPRTRHPAASRAAAPLVGRQRELMTLRDAYADARGARTTVVTVHGTSGIGKTALVRSFLDELGRNDPSLPVLKARCYEQESVPFKALDGIVDGIAAYLRRLSSAEAEGLLPRDVLALARLFPVLKQVPAIASARRRVLEVIDTHELRRRAFGALRELMARLGEQTVPILFIDDLHWGDLDSAVLLAEVLRPPDPPRLLLLGTYRTEETETSPFLRHILPLRALAAPAVNLYDLPLSTIPAAAATELAILLLGTDWPESATEASTIAHDSGGNPFLLDELASYEKTRRRVRRAKTRIARKGRRPLRFDEVIRARVAQLPPATRHVLEAVCIAGRPIDEGIVESVARSPAPASTIDVLKQERFIRTRVVNQTTLLEPYHDRIREAVVRRLSPSVARSYHASLASELERAGQSDPEALAFHFEAAGESSRAADYARRAADRAIEGLAFDHAAQLYSTVLRVSPPHIDQHHVRVLLADALAHAGRGLDSATHYLEAAEHVRGLEAHELRRRATQQLLTSGHIQTGLQVMDRLMRSVGMKVPRSRARSLASLVWNRGILLIRGTRFHRRTEREIPPESLLRLDTCWSVTIGLMFVRPLTALMLQARHVRMALSLGEPYRVSRALALDAGFMAASGVRRHHTTNVLLKQAQDLANEIANPHAMAVTTLAEGFVRFFQGRWRRALDGLEAGETMLRERCTGVAWEMHATELYSMWCLYYLGRTAEIERRLEPLLEDVRRRKDLFLEAGLSTMFLTFLAVAQDNPKLGREQLQRISELRLDEEFTVQHFWDLEARVLLALYEGDGEAAFREVGSRAREFTVSGLARIQQNRLFYSFWRGRATLAAAVTAKGPLRLRLLRQAAAEAAAVHKEGADWGEGLYQLLEAGRAILNGDDVGAIRHLVAGQKAFEAAEFIGPASVAGQLRCGQLVGGPDGDRMAGEARSWFTDHGFAQPDRFAGVYVPHMITRPVM